MSYKLVIDTETCNTLAHPLVYDIAGVISDTKGNIIDTFNFFISETIDDESLFNPKTYFAGACKFEEYRKMRDNRIVPTVPFKVASTYIKMLMIDHGIKCAYAFNSAFDSKAIALTANHCKCDVPITQWRDIMGYAQMVICTTSAYIKFAIDNDCINEDSGNVRGNAESICRYINNDATYVEAHTALSDAIDETAILHYAIKHKGHKHTSWECVNRWNDIKKMRLSMGL